MKQNFQNCFEPDGDNSVNTHRPQLRYWRYLHEIITVVYRQKFWKQME